jgi:hypothetical protein
MAQSRVRTSKSSPDRISKLWRFVCPHHIRLRFRCGRFLVNSVMSVPECALHDLANAHRWHRAPLLPPISGHQLTPTPHRRSGACQRVCFCFAPHTSAGSDCSVCSPVPRMQDPQHAASVTAHSLAGACAPAAICLRPILRLGRVRSIGISRAETARRAETQPARHGPRGWTHYTHTVRVEREN